MSIYKVTFKAVPERTIRVDSDDISNYDEEDSYAKRTDAIDKYATEEENMECESEIIKIEEITTNKWTTT